jgi:hypothetical protein
MKHSSIRPFNGEKEAYEEFIRLLRVDLMSAEIFHVATNATTRPVDPVQVWWHADPNQTAYLAIMQEKTKFAQYYLCR